MRIATFGNCQLEVVGNVLRKMKPSVGLALRRRLSRQQRLSVRPMPACNSPPISSEPWPSAAKRPRNSALCSLRLAELGFLSSDWRARLNDVLPQLLAANVLKKAN